MMTTLILLRTCGGQLPDTPSGWAASVAIWLAMIALVTLGTRKDWF